uniref:Putative ovule protein n=1 Tax=Solanum chacoense TaxID=4108 RepID=A0A0V0GJ86_SOLCH
MGEFSGMASHTSLNILFSPYLLIQSFRIQPLDCFSSYAGRLDSYAREFHRFLSMYLRQQQGISIKNASIIQLFL